MTYWCSNRLVVKASSKKDLDIIEQALGDNYYDYHVDEDGNETPNRSCFLLDLSVAKPMPQELNSIETTERYTYTYDNDYRLPFADYDINRYDYDGYIGKLTVKQYLDHIDSGDFKKPLRERDVDDIKELLEQASENEVIEDFVEKAVRSLHEYYDKDMQLGRKYANKLNSLIGTLVDHIADYSLNNYGYHRAYEWCIDNWGTKWNNCSGNLFIYDDEDDMSICSEFSSADEPPSVWIYDLFNHLIERGVDIQYIDMTYIKRHDGGSGKFTYKKGKSKAKPTLKHKALTAKERDLAFAELF